MRRQVVALFLTTACGREAPPPVAPTAPASPGPGAPAEEAPFEGTAGVVDVPRPEIERPVTVRDVRVGRHGAFDRFVVELEGDRVPGYHVEHVDRPVHECGSGLPRELAGQGWLEVRLRPARAHDDRGGSTLANRDRRVGLPVLLELAQTCDFEGTTTWVLGLAAANRYRVLELTNPARLVVDVRHGSPARSSRQNARLKRADAIGR
jgi:hypothetical protein